MTALIKACVASIEVKENGLFASHTDAQSSTNMLIWFGPGTFKMHLSMDDISKFLIVEYDRDHNMFVTSWDKHKWKISYASTSNQIYVIGRAKKP